MRLRNLLLATGIAALGAAGAAQAAPVEYNSFTNVQTPGGHTMHQGGSWAVVDTGTDGTVSVSFRCSVNGGDSIATGLLQCYLLGANGSRYEAGHKGSMSGSQALETGSAHGVPRQRYRLCVQGNAFYNSEPTYAEMTLACSP